MKLNEGTVETRHPSRKCPHPMKSFWEIVDVLSERKVFCRGCEEYVHSRDGSIEFYDHCRGCMAREGDRRDCPRLGCMMIDIRQPCTCGSGLEPRFCENHPQRYNEHVMEINLSILACDILIELDLPLEDGASNRVAQKIGQWLKERNLR